MSGLNMWMRGDIANALRGIEATSARQAQRQGDMAAYRAGFRDALVAVALNFGIPPADVFAGGDGIVIEAATWR